MSFGNESFVLLEWEGEATAGRVSSLSRVSAAVELRYDFAKDNTAELCLEALTALIRGERRMLSILWRCLHGARNRHDSQKLRSGLRRLFRLGLS